jgi:scaffold protein (connect acetoacetyl-CoA thiolase and HMG-CoA synthase)
MSIQFWRIKDRYYRLVGNRCEDCGAEFFPPVYRCRKCGSRHLNDKEMPHTGRVLTHTQLHEPLPGFESQVPLNLAVIELQNGARVLGQIVDTPQEKIETGARAKVVFRRVRVEGESGPILYGYKFVIE